jgi:hypothetical protein
MTTPSAAELAAVPLFASLPPEEIQAAAQLFTVRLYPKDAIVATEGDRLDLFTPEELARRVAEDAARWAPIVKASGFRADE